MIKRMKLKSRDFLSAYLMSILGIVVVLIIMVYYLFFV